MSNKINPIDDILSQHSIMLLDGALATELEAHGCNLDDPLW
ncbi:homocysteine S-methyltransferase, partial [Bacillus anthracis]